MVQQRSAFGLVHGGRPRLLGSASVRCCHTSRTSPCEQVPVAIVGAGPVGLTLAHLLAKMGVQSTVLERSPGPPTHPQAHFINVRSMEVFRGLSSGSNAGSSAVEPAAAGGSIADAIVRAARPREEWQRFIYTAGPLLTGQVLGATEHFTAHTLNTIDAHSPQRPMHLPQHRLLPLLIDALPLHPQSGDDTATATADERAPVKLCWGVECTGVRELPGGGGVALQWREAEDGKYSSSNLKQELHARYVVACDGVHSSIRAAAGLGAELTPISPIEQQMINIHFSAPSLAASLRHQGKAAMLSFVYAPEVIGVVVAHDLGRAEFALQLPSFIPTATSRAAKFLSPDDIKRDFPLARCSQLVAGAVGGEPSDITVHSVRGWAMSAAVAPRWRSEGEGESNGSVFLCGDAAHVLPPAGGFGMNTGIQDAHNLSWRLALSLQQQVAVAPAQPEDDGTGRIQGKEQRGQRGGGSVDEPWQLELLAGYERERRSVAIANAHLSVRNWRAVAGLSAALGCDPTAAAWATQAVGTVPDAVLPPPVSSTGTKKLMFSLSLSLSLDSLRVVCSLGDLLAATDFQLKRTVLGGILQTAQWALLSSPSLATSITAPSGLQRLGARVLPAAATKWLDGLNGPLPGTSPLSVLSS